MAVGDVRTVEAIQDLHYIDTGMYDVAGYGAVYVIDAERPAIVDTGIGTHVDRVLEGLESLGVSPADLSTILLTHVHLDHAGGAGFLVDACPNATVVVHERGARHLADPSRLWEGTKQAVGGEIDYYTEPRPVPEPRIRAVQDGDVVELGDRTIGLHDAPGHAPHQVIGHVPTSGVLFAGDAAGIYVPQRDDIYPTTPPPDFDLSASLDTLARMRALEASTLCYTHFGPSTPDGMLARYGEVLESWVGTIESRRDDLGDDAAVVESLVAEADLTDVWGPRKAEADMAMNARGILDYLDRQAS